MLTLDADESTTRLLQGIGDVLPVATERELHLLVAATALISPIYTVLAEAADWVHAGGVDTDLAERYLASMTSAICEDRLQPGSASLLELATEAATPGGLNESARKHIAARGGFQSFVGALQEIVSRLGEPPPPHC